MAETSNPQVPSNDSGKLIGRVLLAVILGEGIWGLLVSLTHDLIVPALAGVLGGDPQSPLYLGDGTFHIPAIFAAFLQFCLAGIVAIILNSYVNRGPRTVRIVRVVPAATVPTPVKPIATVPPPAPSIPAPAVPPVTPPLAVARPISPPAPSPVVATAPMEPKPPAPVPPPAAPPQPIPVAKAPTPAPVPPAKPAKPKKIYYNIVGDPVESDE